MATTIVLVRHGETDWNREHRFQGHADTTLNAAGRTQALELARTLDGERFAGVYTSPLLRARETAEILAVGARLVVRPDDSLMEIDVGSWSGLTTTEVEARFPEAFRSWTEWRSGWEDGETYDELGRRVVAGLVRVAAEHPGDVVLAVTHGGPIRSALAAAHGLAFESARAAIGVVENCGVVRIAIRDGEIDAVD